MTIDFSFKHDNSIFKHTNIKTTHTVIYTLNQKYEYDTEIDDNLLLINNEEPVCAKTVLRIDGTKKYMIKLDSNNKFYNPISIYGAEKNKTFLDKVCRSNDKFKEVSEKTLNLYLKFLDTKNILWLTNAERESE